ncbi:hypothetical protein HYPBUDRAFT_153073 [Hyphopichia burtonii NRRL Y-1933]|uniref:Lysophospholipase NTE1 n=1 Tax=Hyphopichia burtonii NRRL Y-1933 TaxID=984485 RepID=A0A1E4RIT9_9ASCO|nr:hypothetical protein HYPBUDRAFT_153073 [Hyphopichia burtonii NRRL Y-1933]ODV67179.1 hypothetical protein HYPBUDRAFT_153073 [Hyphopichia burtonii NRRL Y-1933]
MSLSLESLLTLASAVVTLETALISSLSASLSPSLILPPARDSSSSISIVTATLWFWLWIFFKVMNYVVVIVPTIILNLLSINYQVTLSLSLILVTLSIMLGISFIIVRYRYLTGYSKDTQPGIKSKKHKDIDIVNDMTNKKHRGENKSTSNYLDEFLSAIKVFGYLERPVFHELTKNMTTQKLSCDEILYLDEKLGFSIVVDGTLQVYTKINDSFANSLENSPRDLESDDEIDYEKGDILRIGDQRYQLLNEVKSGSPLSSLINTLDLFKPLYSKVQHSNTNLSSIAGSTGVSVENFQNYDLTQKLNGQNNTKASFHINPLQNNSPNDSGISPLDYPRPSYPKNQSPLPEQYLESLPNSPIPSSTPTPMDTNVLQPEPRRPDQSPTSHTIRGSPSGIPPSPPHESQWKSSSYCYPDIIARPKPLSKSDDKKKSHANTSATIAIIPYLAFQRVQSKYPKATSHIVTMVLTRLYKVTMNTIHNYLGLTSQILDSEIKLNNSEEDTKLPSYLHEGVIERFYGKPDDKSKDSQSNNTKSNENGDKIEKRPPFLTKGTVNNSSRHSAKKSSSRYVVLDSRSKSSHPGDLLSSVPLSRRSDYYQSHATAVHPDPSEESNDKLNSQSSSNTSTRPHPSHSSKPSSTTVKLHIPTPLKRDHGKVEDIRELEFSGDREETEETSLRIAIVENVFKLIGIDENNVLINNEPLNGSMSSSVNSSVVGLSSLMNGNSVSQVNLLNGNLNNRLEHSIYDTVLGRNRLDSLHSLNSRSDSPIPTKVYNTISQSQLKNQNVGDSSIINNLVNGQGLKNKAGSHSSDLNFNDIKNEFGKYLEVKYIQPNKTIVEQGSFNSGLYYVIDGSLDVYYKSNSTDTEAPSSFKKLYSVQPGGLAGYISSIVGFRSLVSIRTLKDKGCIVAHISKSDFSKLSDKYYFLQLPVASKLKSLLSKEILIIDYALEWCHIPAGDVLCSQGDVANGFHIVLSGRFRVIKNNNPRKSEVHLNGSTADIHNYNDNLIDETTNNRHNSNHNQLSSEDYEVLGEYGHGESIGEVEVLTASRRTNSLIAVRDSETARIPRTLFEMLSLKNPSIMVKVSRIVASRMVQQSGNKHPHNQYMNTSVAPIPTSTTPYISNDYKTITILPSVSGLPVREFADKLVSALKSIGRNVIALDQASTLTHLGRHAFDERLAQLKLSGYFAYLEEEYETIVYVCDTPIKSNWTSTCISQGDCILLLADAEDDDVAINAGDYERLLIKLKTTARTDLCLIHPDKYVVPGSTSIWLKNRIWVQGHHHIQMELNRDKNRQQNKKKPNIISDLAAKISSKTNPNIKIKFENVKSKAMSSLVKLNSRLNRTENMAYKSVQSHKNDFLRLARILSNEAVGLVLGGGGSRGISHVGVVMALEKHGIPIDLIGGTSIGSFVGGLYAMDYNIVSIYGRAKKFAKRVSSLWRSIFDLTYPVTSYITGYEFNRGIWKLFGFAEIEDFWIKYFCNSTNITNSTMDIHESGYAWRFIRASMSLAGLLPPIAFNGCMLLDGGYLDNLPVMEMKKKGAKYIIAVDVGSADDRTPMNYGDTLSGFWVLFNRWNPFSKHPNVPNMMDIQLRLAYVASVNALEMAKKTPGVIYLRPPIDDYATLDFAKFDEIHHVGLAYADSLLSNWEQNGRLPQIAGMIDKSKIRSGDVPRSLYRRNSI